MELPSILIIKMNNGVPDILDNLIDELSRLPGIGRRSARRIAFHILHKPPEDARALADALNRFVDEVRFCSVCGAISEADPCGICAGDDRVKSVICVVEEISDLLAIEATGSYKGHYHVLGGVLDPLSGVGPDELNIDALIKRLEVGGIEELIIATNPNTEGDTTAMFIAKLAKPLGVNVTRIARGLPVGG
ncbi:MAG TPA: recombination protein RecR, partial [candidate division Zixibacteria bacterium]|nr:recombination protein RecR [candidate division Zixibacteria bacterium]